MDAYPYTRLHQYGNTVEEIDKACKDYYRAQIESRNNGRGLRPQTPPTLYHLASLKLRLKDVSQKQYPELYRSIAAYKIQHFVRNHLVINNHVLWSIREGPDPLRTVKGPFDVNWEGTGKVPRRKFRTLVFLDPPTFEPKRTGPTSLDLPDYLTLGMQVHKSEVVASSFARWRVMDDDFKRAVLVVRDINNKVPFT
jgi:hypothetical protein